jgi:ABC-type transport system involved in multi-copper enzyme maturation permease subunit
MILLPVIERELRVAARSRATYRTRFLAALAVIGVTVWLFYERRWIPENQIGKEIFENVSLTALIVSLLAGLFSTADSISEERREGTLGLLYLTDLRSGHVALGKLVGNSIPAFFSLAVVVPLLGIPFLLGGVTGAEMARTSLVLVNALWLSVTAGLLGSTMSKDDRITRLMTFIFVLLASVVAPLVGAKLISAFWAWEKAQDKFYTASVATDFWISMAAQFALAWLCLGLAAWRARILWQEKPKNAQQQKIAENWREWSTGSAVERKSWREVLLQKNPALWLACRRRSRTALFWGLLGIGAVVLVWIWQMEYRVDPAMGLLFSIVFHLVIKVTIAFAAARGLADEARSGGLELLLTTELSPGSLIRGVLGGLTRSFGAGIAVVALADAVWIAMGRVDTLLSRDFKIFLWIRLGFLFFDSITLALYALWIGVKTQRSGRAALRALLMVIVAPNLLAIVLFSQFRRFGNSYELTVLLWFVLNCVLIPYSIRPLLNLREKAAEQFSSNSARG